jgi:hypothetical protein
MRLKIINGKTYYILEEFVNPFGRLEVEFIVNYDNDIFYLKKEWNGIDILNLQSVKDEIDNLLLEKGKWRSLTRWQTHLEYYEGIKLLMIKHTRSKLIDDILKGDEYYGPFNPLILAC